MAYININEYDRTITGPKSYSNNVVAIPLNASDGPSDRWVVVNTYDEFIQLFGPNPAQVSQFGNSWEYAANLLLREMPVCVRRITHKLNEDGTNSPDLLTGISIAKGILKVKDVTGNGAINPGTLKTSKLNVFDNNKSSVLTLSEPGTMIADNNYKSKINHPDAESMQDSEYKFIDTPITSIYDLQKGGQLYVNYDGAETPLFESNINVSGAFVDVNDDGSQYPFTTSSNEWAFIGSAGIANEKYKGTFKSEEEFRKTCQSISGQKGDFCVVKDGNTEYRYDYDVSGEANPLFLDATITYPWDLDDISMDSLSNGKFVDVDYNSDNSQTINAIWEYNETVTTEVKNPDFVDGTREIKLNGKTIKIFEKESDITSLPGADNQFAVLIDNYDTSKKDTELNVLFFVYSDVLGEWGANNEIPLSVLTQEESTVSTYNLDYRVYKLIHWSTVTDEKSNLIAQNTAQYSHRFNWINSNDTKFLTRIYWKNTNKPIGYSAHAGLQDTKVKINHIILNSFANTSSSTLKVEVNDDRSIEITPDTSSNRLISGKVGFTNYCSVPLNIYDFKINQRLDSGEITNIYSLDLKTHKEGDTNVKISTDPALKFIDISGNEVSSNQFVKYDKISEKWYIEIQPLMTVNYNKDLTNTIVEIKLAAFNDETIENKGLDVEFRLAESSIGCYGISFSSLPGNILNVTKTAVEITSAANEDIDNLFVNDGYGNYNLFTVEYKYPGTNGNSLSATIKTIANRGIFIQVYRNSQLLEQIELCSFRYRLANGRVGMLNQSYDKDKIWKVILYNFGISLDPNIPSNAVPLYGNYVTIRLNKNITNYESLDYVDSLYAQTGNQFAYLSGGSNAKDEHVLHEVPHCFEPLKDKYRYDIKFVSSGTFIDELTFPKNVSNLQYPVSDKLLIEDSLVDLADTRKDCIAYLDVPYDLTVDLVPLYFQHLSTSYAAAYDPWCLVILDTGNRKWMPPSFVQLFTHAKSILNGNKLYLPPAGVNRALVPEIITTNHELSSKCISTWQSADSPQFINPIIWINGFDYTVYGQKTLYNAVNSESKYESALQNLNVRLVANEIKKLIFKTCISLTFELNNIMTWNEFKSKLNPTLSTMQGEGVLSAYEVLMGNETMTAADLNTGHIVGTVRASISAAATDWDINFEITPNSVTFSEIDYNGE